MVRRQRQPIPFGMMSLGAMAFGGPLVSVMGFMQFSAMVLVTGCALLFFAARFFWRKIPRAPKPLRPENTCSAELLQRGRYPETPQEIARRERRQALEAHRAKLNAENERGPLGAFGWPAGPR